VLVPAVESARLQFTEGLSKQKTMKQALCESLEKASDEDRKVMEEALHNLNIDVEEPKEVSNPEVEENIEVSDSTVTNVVEKTTDAIDDGSAELIKNLQEALSKNSELEGKIKELLEQAAVNDVKVSKLEEDLERSKSTVIRLTTIAKNSRELSKKVSTLEEELKQKSQVIDTLTKENEEAKKVAENESTTKLTESMNSLKTDHEKEVNALKESYNEKLNNSNKLIEELQTKVAKSDKIKEGYKKLANSAVNKYIELRAKNMGIAADEIKGKLSNSYTLDDIDRVCESIQSYELNISKLPFNVDRKVQMKISSKEKAPISQDTDDFVDDTLMGVAETV
jgi:chromosome segregation ATPase